MDIIQLPIGTVNEPVTTPEPSDNIIQLRDGVFTEPEEVEGPSEAIHYYGGLVNEEVDEFTYGSIHVPDEEVNDPVFVDNPTPYTIQLRRGLAWEWTYLNPVLADGEPAYESDTGQVKIGNGASPWSELKYIPSESTIITLIEEAIADLEVESAASVQQALDDHIVSPTPHPAYDNAPSLTLLYQNAKV